MSEERHVSCIEASDSPCTPETCEELICWVCEEPDPSWPCPTRRAQDAEAAIARVRELIDSADNNGEWPWMLVRVSAVREILEGDKR